MVPNYKFIWTVSILVGIILFAVFGIGYKFGKTTGFSDGYNTCTQEFSPDGNSVYPDPWKK